MCQCRSRGQVLKKKTLKSNVVLLCPVNLLLGASRYFYMRVPSGEYTCDCERDGGRDTEICLVRETSCYSVEMTHSSVR